MELNKSEFLQIRNGHALLSSVAKTRSKESVPKTSDIAIANARMPYLNNETMKRSAKAPLEYIVVDVEIPTTQIIAVWLLRSLSFVQDIQEYMEVDDGHRRTTREDNACLIITGCMPICWDKD